MVVMVVVVVNLAGARTQGTPLFPCLALALSALWFRHRCGSCGDVLCV